MRLVLFDIDGTLIDSDGAGRRALNLTLEEHFNLESGLSAVDLAGKTDPLIVREALRRAGREGEMAAGGLTRVFLQTYFCHLRRELQRSPGFRVLAGVRKMLDRMVDDSRFILAIATGNVEEGARLKLRKAGLEGYFRFGGFGCDAEVRSQLISRAISRAGRELERVFVVGDTPDDIIHGRAAGALTVAVASGAYSADQLRPHHPDLLLESLDPITPAWEFLQA